MKVGNFEIEYSKKLDDDIKLLLQEYRAGLLTVEELLKLIDMACRDNIDFRKLGSINGLRNTENQDIK